MNKTYTELVAVLDNAIYNKSGVIPNLRDLINSAVLKVINTIDMRGTKRRVAAPYAVHEDVYTYAAPSDLKATAVIDILKIAEPKSSEPFRKFDPTEFEELKGTDDQIMAVNQDQNGKTLLLDKDNNEISAVIDRCENVDNITVSNNASGLTLDTENYVEGTGSAKFIMADGIGVGNVTITPTVLDLDSYVDEGVFYVWHYLATITGLTNIICKFGNDSSNYFSVTATSNADGTAFYKGWNLMKFNWLGSTETGTVDTETMDYFDFTITTDATFVGASNFRIDNFILTKGISYTTIYYSKNAWVDILGAKLQESTASTDELDLEADEIMLIEEQIKIDGAKSVNETGVKADAQDEYLRLSTSYVEDNPSERILTTTNYY